MGLYSDLSNEELVDKIKELRTKYESALGGGVVRVSGKGRMMEYGRANAAGLKGILRDAQNELAARGGDTITGAIGVIYP